jgi:ferritin
MTPKMIISPELKNALDDAVHSELYASNLYKHVANQLQRIGYFGAQKFFLKESADELEHYQRHVDFQNDVGTVAKVPMIEAMTESIKTLSDAVELGYETELELYNDYKRWYEQAASDPVVQQFLLQFLEIQRTSVGEYGDLLARIQVVDQDKAGMLLIDQELGG